MAFSKEKVATGLLGALFDRDNTAKLADAQQASTAATIADQQRSRDESRKSLTGTSGNVETTQNAGGGFDSGFTRGSGDDLLNIGDEGRANTSNQAGADFNFTVPNLGAAQGIVDRDNALAQSGVDRSFNQATLRSQQTGSPGSTNFNPNLLRAQGDVADKLRMNRERDAIGLLQGSQQGDLATLSQQIAANQPLAPDIKGVGPSASTINSTIPLASRVSDPTNAATGLAGSNLIAQLQQQQALEDSKQDQLAMVRALGDAGAWNKAPITG